MTAALALLMSVLVISELPASQSNELELRWRRDYPIAVQEWDKVGRSVTMTGQFTFHSNNGTTTTIGDLNIVALGDRRLFSQNNVVKRVPGHPEVKEVEGVYCRTPDYMFDLQKIGATGRFSLVTYQKHEGTDQSQFDFWYDQYARSATVYLGHSLLQRMNDTSFKLISVGAQNREGTDIVRINYSWEGPYASETGNVDLDPTKNWAILGVDVVSQTKKAHPPYNFKEDVTYQNIDGGYFVRHMQYFGRTPNPNVYEKATVDLKLVSFAAPSGDQFRLKHYGLPEVPLVNAPTQSIFSITSPIFLVAFTIAVASIFGLRVFRRPS